MNALKEIREVVDETTEELIRLRRWHPCRGNGKTLRQTEIILQKAAAFDKISGIMEKEEADWWEK
jgi:hypothetical protein